MTDIITIQQLIYALILFDLHGLKLYNRYLKVF